MVDDPRPDDPHVTNDGPISGKSGGPGLDSGAAGDAAAGGNGATESTDATREAMEKAALHYAARGRPVFVAPPGGKKGYKAGKYSNKRRWAQTRNANQIRQDFKDYPNANIGLPTGIEAGSFVIEADTPKGHGKDGLASLKAMEEKYGPLPDTLMSISPSGSVHRHYINPPGVKIKGVSDLAGYPGVDVRGEGNMVIAPPSILPGVGQYRWVNPKAPVAHVSAPWLELVKEKEHDPPRHDDQEGDNEPSDVDRDKIKAALNATPSDSYTVWFENGCALYAELGDDGFTLFAEWSKKSTKYNAIKCGKQWEECKRGYD
jgi:hypothetical protein